MELMWGSGNDGINSGITSITTTVTFSEVK